MLEVAREQRAEGADCSQRVDFGGAQVGDQFADLDRLTSRIRREPDEVADVDGIARKWSTGTVEHGWPAVERRSRRWRGGRLRRGADVFELDIARHCYALKRWRQARHRRRIPGQPASDWTCEADHQGVACVFPI